MKTDSPRGDTSEPRAAPLGEAAVRAALNEYDEVASAGEEFLPDARGPAPDTAADADTAAGTESEAAAPASDELAAARAEAAERQDQLLRARAELENQRRRHANELEKAHKFALDGFVRELLQVRDSLELGQDAARDESADLDRLREGMALTLKLLADVMDKFGVAAVDPLDQPFDPSFHQAMSVQPRADVPPNTVVAVLQRGYTLNGRLVRPALVMVSRQES